MSEMYLSKAVLRQDASTNTLATLLDPSDDNSTLDAHHKLLWSLFSDSTDRKRDFLWRSNSGGQFMLLSRRKPNNQHKLFDLQTSEFEPVLNAGDHLRFSLRVNAVVSRWIDSPSGKRRVRHDIVMDAMRRSESEADEVTTTRSELRDEKTQQVANQWIIKQGQQRGFKIQNVLAQAYSMQRVPRRGSNDARFGVLDLEGQIIVEDGRSLLLSMAQGFGKAKAFGNGLMLIRRA